MHQIHAETSDKCSNSLKWRTFLFCITSVQLCREFLQKLVSDELLLRFCTLILGPYINLAYILSYRWNIRPWHRKKKKEEDSA